MNKSELITQLQLVNAINTNFKKPYTWASGIHSPIYIDNRLINVNAVLRRQIAAGLIELIDQNFGGAENIQAIYGTATAGISHATLVADALSLPMGYVRNSKKDHGKENLIEGYLHPGTKVILVEDLISTGGSVLQAVQALRQEGVIVVGVVAIFSYGLQRATNNFYQQEIEYASLINFHDLSQHHTFNYEQQTLLEAFFHSLNQ